MPIDDPWDVADKSDYEWLISQMSGRDLWMDGTSYWHLPHSVLSGIRARTALEAIREARARYESQVAEYQQKPLDGQLGA